MTRVEAHLATYGAPAPDSVVFTGEKRLAARRGVQATWVEARRSGCRRSTSTTSATEPTSSPPPPAPARREHAPDGPCVAGALGLFNARPDATVTPLRPDAEEG